MLSLMYDLVLLARNERDLQHMLEVVNQWCSVWNVTVYTDKSQIVHFRPRAMNCTRYGIKFGSLELGIVDRYRYCILVYICMNSLILESLLTM